MQNFKEFKESGIVIEAVDSYSTPRKTPFYYSVDNKLTRSLVTCILCEYVNSKEPVCFPVKCIDAIGCAGTSGLLWKKHLGEKVDVRINDPRPESKDLIKKNALRNGLIVDITSDDPCITLLQRGYNFIYLDCTTEASHFFDAAFRNISRNGVLVITCKDDCSMHGNTPDVALRRYGGRITRSFYYHELGIRLIIAAMARTAIKYNKSISVLCSFMHKSSFTVAVMTQKGPDLANKNLDNIRAIKHCMVCEEREFYPIPNGFPIEPSNIKLSCDCNKSNPGSSYLELGPVWAGAIFNVNFIERMMQHSLVNSDLELKSQLSTILLEAQCSWKDDNKEKRQKIDSEVPHPPFYYNIHKYHPHLAQLMKINKIIEGLKESGFRASKTHFDKLAIRTDATLDNLFQVMKTLDRSNC